MFGICVCVSIRMYVSLDLFAIKVFFILGKKFLRAFVCVEQRQSGIRFYTDLQNSLKKSCKTEEAARDNTEGQIIWTISRSVILSNQDEAGGKMPHSDKMFRKRRKK